MADLGISGMLTEQRDQMRRAGAGLSDAIGESLFSLTQGEMGFESQTSKISKIRQEMLQGIQGGGDELSAVQDAMVKFQAIGATDDATEAKTLFDSLSTEKERLSQQTERGKPATTTTGTPVDPERLAETAKYNQLIQEFGTEQGPIKFLEWQQEQKKILAEAGVTEAQEGLAPSVVTAINSAYNKSLKPLNDSIGQLDKGLSFVNQLEAGNPAAQTQLDKMLATLSGDTQLSEVEVKRVLRVGNLPTRIVDTVSRFFLGTEAAETVEEKKTLISAMREVIVERQKLEQARLKETWKHAQGVTGEILNDMFSVPADTSGGGYTQEDIDAERRRRGLI